MTLLWIALLVCAAVMAAVALSSLDRQRRLFFTTGSLSDLAAGSDPSGSGPAEPTPTAGSGGRDPRGGRQRHGSSAARLRHLRSRVRGVLAGMTQRRGARTLRAGGGNTLRDVLADVAFWRPRREHAARIVLRAMSESGSAPPPEEGLRAAPVATNDLPADGVAARPPTIDTVMSTATAAGNGIVRVDTGGQLQSPDAVARGLLHWSGGPVTLSDILAGGRQEATALLESVARREVVEQTVTVLAGGSSQQLHITAFASRHRDGSLGGALLILRRP